MRTLPSLLCAAVLLGPVRAQDKPKIFSLYPLKKGAKWTYKAGPDTIVVVVKGSMKIEMDDQFEVETTGPDGTKNEHIIVRPNGVFRTAVGNVGVKPVGMCILMPPPEMKLDKPPTDKPEQPKPVTWMVDAKVGQESVKGTFTLGEAEIEIGKMKYKTVMVSCPKLAVSGKDVSKEINLTCYYAENIGLVKQVAKVEGTDVVLELVKYNAPKE